MNTVDLSETIYETLRKFPELKDIFIEIGFKPLENKHMVETVGRLTSLKQGSKIAGIPIESIENALKENGYLVK